MKTFIILFGTIVIEIEVSVVTTEANEVNVSDWAVVLYFQEWFRFIVIGKNADGTSFCYFQNKFNWTNLTQNIIFLHFTQNLLVLTDQSFRVAPSTNN